MTTADQVKDRALDLAQMGTPEEEAIRDLLDCCGERRVSVVRARRELMDQGDADQAVRLLDEVLARFPAV
jgi:thioredoxin-like negative regulator of GroEL